MTNLDYEQRMSALNQLIHETLGVSLNTVRAAYGRARNTSFNIRSIASTAGMAPVSKPRPVSLASLMGSASSDGIMDARGYAPAMTGSPRHPVLGRMPRYMRRTFQNRFRRASLPEFETLDTDRTDAIPMLVLSKSGTHSDTGSDASDWHKLRNEFWNVAQADQRVMERYKRDVLG